MEIIIVIFGVIIVLSMLSSKSTGQNNIKRKSKKSVNYSPYSEEEMDAYALEEWQKEEVRNGNADPWSFEEEDLEEDDWYAEDDE